MSETWKDIVGYEGLYQVSTLGRVKSLTTGCIRKTYFDTNGYQLVTLNKNGQKTRKRIHRIVAETFIDGFNVKLDVNHKDGNKSNNCVENLEWCTRSQNVTHAFRNGLNHAASGEKNGKSKLTEPEVLQIREAWDRLHNYCKVARMFSVNEGTVWAIVNGKTWKGVT